MDSQTQFAEGMTVYGADNDKIGKVIAVDSGYIVVEKGFFFPSDYYIPTSAVASSDGDSIYLNVTKEQALDEQTWAEAPVAGGYTESTDMVTTAADVDTTVYDDREVSAGTDRSLGGTSTTYAQDSEALRVPVYEEDLSASVREVDRGAVRIEKDVVSEERSISVPVTEERVRVTRVETDRNAAVDADHVFEEGVIEVPVHGQEVDLQKTARMTGEVVIEKEAVQTSEQVGGTVRREEVRVDEGVIDATDRNRR